MGHIPKPSTIKTFSLLHYSFPISSFHLLYFSCHLHSLSTSLFFLTLIFLILFYLSSTLFFSFASSLVLLFFSSSSSHSHSLFILFYSLLSFLIFFCLSNFSHISLIISAFFNICYINLITSFFCLNSSNNLSNLGFKFAYYIFLSPYHQHPKFFSNFLYKS